MVLSRSGAAIATTHLPPHNHPLPAAGNGRAAAANQAGANPARNHFANRTRGLTESAFAIAELLHRKIESHILRIRQTAGVGRWHTGCCAVKKASGDLLRAQSNVPERTRVWRTFTSIRAGQAKSVR